MGSTNAKSQNRRAKDQAMAEYMRKMGITRKSGACPWGCGRQVPNGGPALLIHLSRCRGGGARRNR